MGKIGTQCCAFGCNKRKKRKGQLIRSDSEGSDDEETKLKRLLPRTFHRFPLDPVRRAKWVEAVCREKWSPSKYTRLCSDHFRESDIYRIGQVVQLRENAVPTRFKKFPKHLRKAMEKQKPPAEKWSDASQVTKATPATQATTATSATQATKATSVTQVTKTTLATQAMPASGTTTATPATPTLTVCEPDSNKAFLVNVIASDHIYQMKTCAVHVISRDHLYQMTDSPSKIRAKMERSTKQILQLRKELKVFQQKSRRLKSKVMSMKCVVKQLKKEIKMSQNCEMKVQSTVSGEAAKAKKKKTSGPRTGRTEMEMQLPPHQGDVLSVVDMHTGGEPLRIVLGGYPPIEGDTVLAKRRYVRDHLDHLRGVLMLEPRGHFDMYGALIVDSELPDADLAVLFMHNEGYSTMCGHAVIALGRFAVDYKLVKEPQSPETQVNIHCPCGMVRAFVEYSEGKTGSVRFLSVPAFVFATDVTVAVEGFGEVKVDISYGGAFYAFVDAQKFGLNVTESRIRELVDAATAVTKAVKAQVQLHHPTSDDLAFLYGTILTDGNDAYSSEPTANICVFAKAQVDRSPTGSGVTARVALQHHKGLIQLNQTRTFLSGATGSRFTGKAVEETKCGDFQAVVVEVAGRAFYTGVSRFVQEPEDKLTHGFLTN